jgi:acetolactate synthase-1/2/3 large subunit
MTMLRTGGEILVSALRGHGCDRIFGVPGESYLPLLDALYDSDDIQFVTCRHEAGAANMAEADGKLVGRPGICAVSRGPGAMHAAIGLHTAQQDSTPMILLVGQVPTSQRGLGAFQEMDYKQVFGSVAKYVAEITDPADIPDTVAEAYRQAMTGRRGPVVLSLPEDMLAAKSDVTDQPAVFPTACEPDPMAVHALAMMLAEAERPLLIVGGSGWDRNATIDIAGFAERFGLPIVSGFRCQDIVPVRHGNYIGDLGFAPSPALLKRVRDADLLLVVGERLGDLTTQGYTMLSRVRSARRLVHVYPDAAEIGRVFEVDLAIEADMGPFAHAAAALEVGAIPSEQQAWLLGARQDYLDFQTLPAFRSRAGCVDMTEVMGWLRETLPRDTIVTNGAGNYSGWVNRFYRYDGFRTQLAPVSGAMGYGLPAAIAAKLRYPERPVVAFAGDGCFTMAMTELATALQYDIGIIVIVVNNSQYGSIRMHQEKEFPGRSIGVALSNPDFAAVARGFGAFGIEANDLRQFQEGFAQAASCGRCSVIDIAVDPTLITPSGRLHSTG